MSIRMIALAFEARCESPAEKLVLLKLADNASDEGECWPTQGYMERHTELSISSIRRAIRRLESAGMLRTEPTFDRNGAQGANRYWLTIDGAGQDDRGGRSPRPGGAVTTTGGAGHHDRPNKPSSKPSVKPNTQRVRARVNRPDWIEDQIWTDWLRTRKAPLTPTAWDRIRPELERGIEAGYSANDMLAEAIEAGWRGFRLDWYENRIKRAAESESGRQGDSGPSPAALWNEVISAAANPKREWHALMERRPELREAIRGAGGFRQIGLMNEWQQREARSKFIELATNQSGEKQ